MRCFGVGVAVACPNGEPVDGGALFLLIVVGGLTAAATAWIAWQRAPASFRAAALALALWIIVFLAVALVALLIAALTLALAS